MKGRPGRVGFRASDHLSAPTVTQVVLFSRRRCHLCDDARSALQAAGIGFAEMDVDTDPLLQAEYGTSVPVVEVGGVPVFEAGMDPSTAAGLVREGLLDARARARRQDPRDRSTTETAGEERGAEE